MNRMRKNKVVSLAIPLILAQLAQASTSFVDTILMGMLGVDALSGGGLGAAAYQLVFLICIGVLAAVSNLTAYEHGKGHHEQRLQRILHAGLLIALVLAVFWGIVLWYLDPFLLWLEQPEQTVAQTMVYLRAVQWALLPALAFMVLRNFILGFGHAGALLRISVIAAALNFPVSYCLMTGMGLFPGLGLAGIGYGTAIVSLLMFVLFCLDVYRKEENKPFRFWRYTTEKLGPELAQLWRLGIPIALAIAMEAGLFSVSAVLAGQLGAAELASHQIALQCITLSFMFPLGISQAISILVGQHYGAGQWQALRQVYRQSILLGLMCSTTGALIFWTIPELLIGLFTQAETATMAHVASLAVGLLAIAAVFQIVDGLQVITMGALRGLKQGMGPTILTVMGYWGLGFPLAWYLKDLYSVSGIWMGLGIGLGSTALMLALYYKMLVRKITA